jgi:O-antigen ligase
MIAGLGVAAYFQDFLGLSTFTLGSDLGLPQNYWTGIGGHLIRRAGSVYLNGQGFAVPFLLFFPLATAWVFIRPKRTGWLLFGYSIVAIGLLLTLTRMTIVIAFIQLALFVTLRKRPEFAVAGLAMAGAMMAAIFILVPGFPSFVWQTLSFQESSSASHANDWANGIAAFAQHPWGSGLGTADQTALRAGLKHITGDNLYLKYAVEMGVLGVTLFVASLCSIGSSAMRLYRHGKTLADQRMGMTLWLATVGIAINGITAVVFNSITLGWLFFWLAGAVITVSERRTASSVARAPEPIPVGLTPAR